MAKCSTNSHDPTQPNILLNKNKPQQQQQQLKSVQSWSVIRSILKSCKHIQTATQAPRPRTPHQHHEVKNKQKQNHQQHIEIESKRFKKMKCYGSSICSTNSTTNKALERPADLPSSAGSSFRTTTSSSSSRSMKPPPPPPPLLQPHNVTASSSYSDCYSNNSNVSSGSVLKGMHFRRLAGCYECKMALDPVVLGFTRSDPSLKSTVSSCPDCGEEFIKADQNLETHRAVKHAVSELGPEDTSRNIVEIIFQSSWLKKQAPICKIERILKVHNTPKTISDFESYRESIKSKANKTLKKHPRCVADGNELLRFHCTTLLCSLGLNGSTSLCTSIPTCGVCNVIRNGFSLSNQGILTTATSGKADDKMEISLSSSGGDNKRAMLVCRVIAGRVKRGNCEEFDSVSDGLETYSSLDELYVFNQKAILPCFVVIYGKS